MNAYQNYLLEALDTVSAWDLDDDSFFTEAINSQIRLLAQIQSDEYWCFDSETPIH
jgi:hypothetical protein